MRQNIFQKKRLCTNLALHKTTNRPTRIFSPTCQRKREERFRNPNSTTSHALTYSEVPLFFREAVRGSDTEFWRVGNNAELPAYEKNRNSVVIWTKVWWWLVEIPSAYLKIGSKGFYDKIEYIGIIMIWRLRCLFQLRFGSWSLIFCGDCWLELKTVYTTFEF